MGVATFQSSTRRGARALTVLACGLAAASLGGCGSISEKFAHTIADNPTVGLPAGTPERPANTLAYPAVHDMPPARPAALSGADQIKMENELMAARDRQQNLAGQPVSPPPTSYAAPPPAKKPAQPAAAPAARPGSSSASTIY